MIWNGEGTLPVGYGQEKSAPSFAAVPDFASTNGEYGIAPVIIAAIIAGGVGVATTGVSVGMQFKGRADAMRMQHACIRKLDRDVDHAMKKMWSSTIFTKERVAWEKKANALKAKRKKYLKYGCPEALALAKRKKSSSADAAPAPVTEMPPPAPPTPGVPMWAWVGGGLLLAAAATAAVAASRRRGSGSADTKTPRRAV